MKTGLPVRAGYVRAALFALAAAWVALAATTAYAQSVVRGPYLQLGTENSVVVRWRTDQTTNSRVRYGGTPLSLSSRVSEGGQRTEHELELTGLAPGTRYYYSVGTSNSTLAGGDSSFYFDTAPAVGTEQPTRIWVLGDSGTANANAAAVRDAYNTFTGNQATHLWLMLGDNAYQNGTDSEYQSALFDMFPQMLQRSVLWPTLGNHDIASSDSPTESGPYFDMFTLPRAGEAGGVASGTEAYYSFDYANIHFIVLDSADSSLFAGSPMLAWLENDVATATADWIVAFWHHPPYSKGSHDSDDDTVDWQLVAMRENAVVTLEEYGVDLVLSGHSHSYERSYLIDGHYGFSDTFDPVEHVVDGGDGRAGGDGPYTKPLYGANQGTVYTVAGSAGQTTVGTLNHPAMFTSLSELGSVILEFTGTKLDVTFLNSNAVVSDSFTLRKSDEAVVEFSAMPPTGPAPLAVNFTDESLLAASAWAWDFQDDGTIDSTAQHPSTVYPLPGSYSVKLTITTARGVFERVKEAFVVAGLEPPIAEFSGSVQIGSVPLSVDFTDRSSQLPDSWEWDFDGDSIVDSTAQNPGWLYTEPGTYTVSLTATNASGFTTETKQDYIVVAPLVPGEITGLKFDVSRTNFFWDTHADACFYDVVKGDLVALRGTGGQFETSQIGCAAQEASVPSAQDLDDPAPGEAYFYVVRGVTCSGDAGTYDTSNPFQLFSRDLKLQGATAACGCNPASDADGDGYCDPYDSCPTLANVDQTDQDGDGFGDACDCDPASTRCTTDCTDVDGDLFCLTSDCDDQSAETFPGAAPNDDPDACMADVDLDDWGDSTPLPLVAPGSDCDDSDPAITPTTTWYADFDGDGFGNGAVSFVTCDPPAGYVLDSSDCDDGSPTAASTYPGAAPNDSPSACMKDLDGDGWGDDTPPAGVTPGSDCDEDSSTAASTYPGAAPNDSASACMKDVDHDGWGDGAPPAGVAPGTDCDDLDASLTPLAIWYADTDADEFGDLFVSLTQCLPPVGYVSDSTDCDDVSPTASVTFPGAAPNDDLFECMKDADGDDWGDSAPPPGVAPGSDCADDDPTHGPTAAWFADADGDTFGDVNAMLVQCEQPAGYIFDNTDCDDLSATAAATYPGAAPNDAPAACLKDVDGDGWGDDAPPAGVSVGTDCDDDSAAGAFTFPGAAPNDGPGCMLDADGDDWGDATPASGVPAGTDCDDADAQLNPATTWYRDADLDGFGDVSTTLTQCEQPAGHLLDSTDCDDVSPTASVTFPGAAPNDSALACMRDADGDDYGDGTPPAGVIAGSDCDDADALLNADTIWYADTDGDGYGDPGATQNACLAPAAHLADSSDCDDTSPNASSAFPGAAPNDSASACMMDVDGDGWGDDTPPAGVIAGTDCDDDSATAAATYPGAAPHDDPAACLKDVDDDDWGDDAPPGGIASGTDCDDLDASLTPASKWYADTDLDGFGDLFVSLTQCQPPAGYVTDSTDCDDLSPTAGATFPGAAPNDDPFVCMKDLDGDDWGDSTPRPGVVPGADCADDDAARGPSTAWFADADGDTFGDVSTMLVQCEQPASYVFDNTDCDDSSPTASAAFPGAAPSDSASACLKDLDGDGWGDSAPPAGVDPGTDCDDDSATAALTFPGAAPNDGPGCYLDADGDDWGDDAPAAGIAVGTDCADDDAQLNPTTIWYRDADLDGFGDVAVSLTQCTEPAGHLLDSTDCDDTSDTAAVTFPGAAPNDSPIACMADLDADGWGDLTPTAGVIAGSDCDDADPTRNPTTVWFADSDGDTFGDVAVSIAQCTQPVAHTLDSTDCDDTSASAASTFPGAAPNDSPAACMKDVDGDDFGDGAPPAGVAAGTDCLDSDLLVNPNTVWHADTDSDGFGSVSNTVVQCEQPAGHLLDGTDCDDTSATASVTFPGAAPNDGAAACMKDVDGDDWGDANPPAGVAVGADCDDDDPVLNPATFWYRDSDVDGFGDVAVDLQQCPQPPGFVLDQTDCDDTSLTAAWTFPGAAATESTTACMKDVDGDGYGDLTPPAGVTTGTDCDDSDSILTPVTNWYADTDSDSFGDSGVVLVQCLQPAGYLLDNTDCDDVSATAAATFPGAAPTDSPTACMKDVDGDEYGDDDPPAGVTAGTDCVDTDAVLNPVTNWYADTDSDSFGDPGVVLVQCLQPASHVLDNTDCDDVSATAAATFPGAASIDSATACMKDVDGDEYGDDDPPTGVTSGTDCVDTDAVLSPVTNWYADTDSDSFGDPGVVLVQCLQPAGYLLDNTDCDDTSATAASTFPGAAPTDSATACMKDVDGDDYGDATPPAGVSSGSDCDDADIVLNPVTNWYADTDSDSFGDPGVVLVQCVQPASYVLDNTDCDDVSATAASTFPGAAPTDSPTACMKDVDGDEYGDDDPPAGVTAGTDCVDTDAVLNPVTNWYADTDSDSFGDPGVVLVQCLQPASHVLDNTDCDDVSATAAATFPGAASIDSATACMKDVDGDEYGDDDPPAGVTAGTDCVDTDAVLSPVTNWYADTDADSFGDPGVVLVQCLQPAGYLLDNTDCDDTSATAASTFPGAAPTDSLSACMKDVDGDDYGDATPPAGVSSGSDCDDADIVLNPVTNWYADTDSDSFGDPGVVLVQCVQPASYVLDDTDCDDTGATAASIFPGAASIDSATTCMEDVDGDNYGDATPPAGVTAGSDCDDSDPVLNPATSWYADTDADSFGDPGVVLVQCLQPASHVLDNTDCDDTGATAASIFPGAASIDSASACMEDVDGDNYGDATPPAGVTAGSDCDDSDPVLNPATSWYADTDSDSFGDPGVVLVQCLQPAGYLLDNTDCDDTSATAASTFPGAAPTDSLSACMKDVDGDDYGDATPPAGVSSGSDCDDADIVLNPVTNWYADTDSDSFGDPGVVLVQCVQPASYVLDATDCDDVSATAASTFPGAAPTDSPTACMKDVDGDEYGDDDPPAGVTAGTDCVDTDAVLNPVTNWYADTDSDSFGDPGVVLVQCLQPASHVLDNTDCDDVSATAAATFPGAASIDSPTACMKDVDGDEYGDDDPPTGVTSGTDCVDTDAVLSPVTNWYADTDSDSFGDPGVVLVQCLQPAGYLLDNTDCDDTSATAAATFPGAAPTDSATACMKDVDGDEYGDATPPAGVSSGSDCDDADIVLTPVTNWYADTDSDSFGDPGVVLVQCVQPASYVLDDTDCDDTGATAASIFPGAASIDSATTCMEDVDGDNYGDATPPAGVTAGTDCDDSDPGINPATTWYADTDADTFGDPGVTSIQCAQPGGYVLENTDCDDTGVTAASIFPGAASIDSATACMEDVDGDNYGDATPPAGVTPGTDCNDADAGINPATIWYADTDGDTFGDQGVTSAQCTQPAGHVADNTDCDDTGETAASIFPGAASIDSATACMEDVDGDNYGDATPPAGVTAGTDCDDSDPGINPATVWYADTDADTFGDPGVTSTQCAQPGGYVLDNTDCDDTGATAASIFPGAASIDSATACMEDVDGDEYGDATPPAGVTAGTDCDDSNAGINPATLWYADTDGDTFGDPGVTSTQCAQPAGYVLDNTDCDDTGATAVAIFPGAASIDSATACMEDVDGDNYGDATPPAGVTPGTDCDDADAGINPATIWYADTDGDTFGDQGVTSAQCTQPAGYVADNTDCDDTGATAASIFPGAASIDSASACMEDVDGDNYGDATPPAGVTAGTDCDDSDAGINPATVWRADTDGDTFGDPNVTLTQCAQPAGYVLDNTDCDDTGATAASIFPGAASIDSATACMEDVDGDNYGDATPPAGVTPGTDCDDADAGINPATVWYADTDGDTFGDPGVTSAQCTQPAGYVADNTDCDDTGATAASIFPGAASIDSATACMEDVDGDNYGDATPPAGVTPGTDCDDADAGINPATIWYADTDGDTFGDPGVTSAQCTQPAGHVADNTDCDDTGATAASIFPGAASIDSATTCMEDVDGDNYGDATPPAGVTAGTDCDDSDAGINPATVWRADTDGDTFGDPNVTLTQCAQPAGYVLDNTDCDDTGATAASIFPGAASIDSATACMEDVDGDNYGDATPPAGVTPGTDCDDADAGINPATIWYADTDGDTFGDQGVTSAQCTQPAGHVADNTDCDDTGETAASIFPGAASIDSATACMEDVDGDNYGDATPPAGVTAGTDCDDSDPGINPATVWYADTDTDTFGDPGVTSTQCAQPGGYVLDNTDCDDTGATAASIFPGAASIDSATACMEDVDGDNYGDATPPAGVTAGTDCDDSDAGINPATVWYADTDGDTFGDPGVTSAQCTQPAGYVADNADCDDTSATAASTYPGAAATDSSTACMKDVDGDDYGDANPPVGVTPGTDCDDADAGINPATVWYADTDGDTFGDPGVTSAQCTQPAGYVADNTDCDDTGATAASIFPGAASIDSASACMEDVDGDNYGDATPPAGVTAGTDCDDSDAGINPATVWRADTDGDTFGDPNVTLTQCAQPAGYVLDNTDCDDTGATAASIFPGAASIDSATACMEDVDGDNYGDATPPAGVTPGTDCDDADAGINPATVWYADTDGDTFGDPGVTSAQCTQPAGHVADNTDCDDTGATAASIFPGAASIDSATACMEDVDGDNYGDATPPAGVTPGTDCDDADAGINPATVWYADTDGDTFGDPGVTSAQCTQPAGYVADNTDCDDTSATAASTYPGAAATDSSTACMKDVDGDNYGDATPPAGVTPGTDCDDANAAVFPGSGC